MNFILIYTFNLLFAWIMQLLFSIFFIPLLFMFTFLLSVFDKININIMPAYCFQALLNHSICNILETKNVDRTPLKHSISSIVGNNDVINPIVGSTYHQQVGLAIQARSNAFPVQPQISRKQDRTLNISHLACNNGPLFVPISSLQPFFFPPLDQFQKISMGSSHMIDAVSSAVCSAQLHISSVSPSYRIDAVSPAVCSTQFHISSVSSSHMIDAVSPVRFAPQPKKETIFCALCTDPRRAFAHQSSLRRHMKTHDHVTFHCDVCGDEFTRRDSVRRHKRKYHHIK